MKQSKKTRFPTAVQTVMEGFEENANAGRIGSLSKGLKRHMTPQERKLYSRFFRQMNIPVVCQKVIDSYIVDFFVAPDTVVELDGSQHFSEDGADNDRKRDEYLRARGYKVLRYANNDVVSNFEAVCEDILNNLE